MSRAPSMRILAITTCAILVLAACPSSVGPAPSAPNSAPTARFSAVSAAYVNEAVSFNASATTDPDAGDVLTYRWDFGDLSPDGSGKSLSHTYASEGSYTVRLTVTDRKGASSTSERILLVMRKLTSSPTAAAAARILSGTVGQPITFEGMVSDPDAGDSVSAEWDFGDGHTAEQSTASHTYAVGGTYSAILTATDSADNTDVDEIVVKVNTVPVADFPMPAGTLYRSTPLAFDGSLSYDGDNEALSYAWDFGDGSTASGKAVTHAFSSSGSYSVSLRVTDPAGANHQIARTASIVNRPPTVSFGELDVAAMNKSVGDSFSFSAEIDDPEGRPLTCVWSLDGSAQAPIVKTKGAGGYTSLSYSFTASSAKVYTVRLRVTDDEMLVAEDEVSVVAADLVVPDEAPPVAFLAPLASDPEAAAAAQEAEAGSKAYRSARSATPFRGSEDNPTLLPRIYALVGRSVAFDLSRSYDQGGLQTGLNAAATMTASWDWEGDGSVDATGLLQAHAFASAGSYTVKVAVRDDEAAADYLAIPIVVVNPPNKPPVAKSGNLYQGKILDGQTSVAITFDGSGSYDPDGSIASYSWVWSDGAPGSSGTSFTRSFTAPGVYTLTLSVTDNHAYPKTATSVASVVVTKEIVNHKPVANLPGSLLAFRDEVLSFTGKNCIDPDGDSLSYSWSVQASDSPTVLASGTGSEFGYKFLAVGDYVVKLVVSDGKLSAEASAAVSVQAPPAVAFKIDLAVPEGGLKLDLDLESPIIVAIVERSAGVWNLSQPVANRLVASPGSYVIRFDSFDPLRPYDSAKEYCLYLRHGSAAVLADPAAEGFFWALYTAGLSGNLGFSLAAATKLNLSNLDAPFSITFSDANSGKLEVEAW